MNKGDNLTNIHQTGIRHETLANAALFLVEEVVIKNIQYKPATPVIRAKEQWRIDRVNTAYNCCGINNRIARGGVPGLRGNRTCPGRRLIDGCTDDANHLKFEVGVQCVCVAMRYI
ncbi:hypothetical protein ACJJTC_015656 [Scirpophaga incertulas]